MLEVDDCMSSFVNSTEDFEGIIIVSGCRCIATFRKVLDPDKIRAINAKDNPQQSPNKLTIG